MILAIKRRSANSFQAMRLWAPWRQGHDLQQGQCSRRGLKHGPLGLWLQFLFWMVYGERDNSGGGQSYVVVETTGPPLRNPGDTGLCQPLASAGWVPTPFMSVIQSAWKGDTQFGSSWNHQQGMGYSTAGFRLFLRLDTVPRTKDDEGCIC